MVGTGFSVPELESIAKGLRRDIIEMTYVASSGHPGGSLSEIDLLTALYFGILDVDPNEPDRSDRDRFILSKSHASPGLYAVLSKRGFFPHEELTSFRAIESRLQGHAHVMTPGVDMSGGSLGQGLSFGVGCALAAKLGSEAYRTYVLIGDGECDEGQVWEAAMSADHYHLDNLTAIIDRNGIQNDRFTSDVMKLEPLADKWKAFGWRVIETDGHDMEQIICAVGEAQSYTAGPSVIIAKTVKGKGVSFMENNPAFHGSPPNKEQYDKALIELN